MPDTFIIVELMAYPMIDVSNEQRAETRRKSESNQPFFSIERSSKHTLLVIAIIILSVILPFMLFSNLTIFGLPWLFVAGPVGFVLVPILGITIMYYMVEEN